MLLPELRSQVLHANQEIARRGLAPHTFGNASGIDRLTASTAPAPSSPSSPAASTTPP
jgi:ribulose-5-phosphate 4-epimerase/fuculose-1-phosphate aldolase